MHNATVHVYRTLREEVTRHCLIMVKLTSKLLWNILFMAPRIKMIVIKTYFGAVVVKRCDVSRAQEYVTNQTDKKAELVHVRA